MIRQPAVNDIRVSRRVDRIDDHVGLHDSLRLKFDRIDPLVIQRPVRRVEPHLVVEQRARAGVGQGDRGRNQVEQLGAEAQALLQRQTPAERPHDSEDEVAREECLGRLVAQRKVGVVVVVVQHASHAALEHAEQRREALRAAELHDVAARSLHPTQRVEHEARGHALGRREQGAGWRGRAWRQAEQRFQQLDAAGLGRPARRAGRRDGLVLEHAQPVQHHHGRGDHLLAEPQHAASGDGRSRRVLQRLDFEDETNVRRERQSLSVWQREQLVVVEDGVEVLNPVGIDVAVEDDPMRAGHFAARVIQHTSQYTSEHAITPVHRRVVEFSVQFFLADGLGIDDVRLNLASFDLLHCRSQNVPRTRFSTDGSHANDSVMDALNLVQLHQLVDPQGTLLQLGRCGQLADCGAQGGIFGRVQRCAGKDGAHERGEERQVAADQLRSDRSADAAHQQLLLLL